MEGIRRMQGVRELGQAYHRDSRIWHQGTRDKVGILEFGRSAWGGQVVLKPEGLPIEPSDVNDVNDDILLNKWCACRKQG